MSSHPSGMPSLSVSAFEGFVPSRCSVALLTPSPSESAEPPAVVPPFPGATAPPGDPTSPIGEWCARERLGRFPTSETRSVPESVTGAPPATRPPASVSSSARLPAPVPAACLCGASGTIRRCATDGLVCGQAWKPSTQWFRAARLPQTMRHPAETPRAASRRAWGRPWTRGSSGGGADGNMGVRSAVFTHDLIEHPSSSARRVSSRPCGALEAPFSAGVARGRRRCRPRWPGRRGGRCPGRASPSARDSASRGRRWIRRRGRTARAHARAGSGSCDGG